MYRFSSTPKWCFGPVIRVTALFVVTNLVSGHNAFSSVQLYRTAAMPSAQNTGVPQDVMFQLASPSPDMREYLTWPWPVTIAGEGTSRLATIDAVQACVFKRLMRGVCRFFVSCFQSEYRRQTNTLASIEKIFDPNKNAMHVAETLRSLHLITRTWTEAVAQYHSCAASGAFLTKRPQNQCLT